MIRGWLPWAAQKAAGSNDWRGPWQVIVDPSGDFLGGRFNWFDIRIGAAFRSWPDGIVFRHINTGTAFQYAHGELFEIGGDDGDLWPLVAAAV